MQRKWRETSSVFVRSRLLVALKRCSLWCIFAFTHPLSPRTNFVGDVLLDACNAYMYVSMKRCFKSLVSRHFRRSYLTANKVSKNKGARKVEYIHIIFIARQHTDARYWYSSSVCLSVRPSVRDGPVSDENGRLNISSPFFPPYGSPIILVLPASNIFRKFRRGHPLRGR